MFDAMNDSVLNVFGEPFTFKGAGGNVVLQGVFDEQVDKERIGGIGLRDRVFTLSLLGAHSYYAFSPRVTTPAWPMWASCKLG